MSSSKPSEGDSSSERTCVVCRKARSPHELLRLSCTAGRVHFALRAQGRGAWVCVRHACISGLSQKALARAFRQPVSEAVEATTLLEEARALAERRVLEMVGLARRQACLDYGAEVVSSTRSGGEAVVIVASDAAPRTRAHLSDPTRTFVGAFALSRAAGLFDVTAVRINPGPLAEQAAYWLSVWYECRASAATTGSV